MRVLLLNDHATPMGGAELQVLRLRALLRARGHEARLLASRASTLAATPQADATCFGTTHPRLRVLSQTANPSAERALRRELARFPPDVVHVRMFLTQLSPLILPPLRAVPTVYQVVFYKAICPRGTKMLPDGRSCQVPAGVACLHNRCVTPQSWLLDMAQQRLWRRWRGALDRVVALTEASRRRLEDAGIAVSQVIPNGVAERPARPPLTGPPLVAFAGRMVPEKGADVLVRAFASTLRRVPDARLLLAGDGPERDRLSRLIHTLGLRGRVELSGHLARDDLERRLDAAWLQAVPGRWDEPLGNVALEAMMRGTAVVASARGGPGEVVQHGRTGRLVPAASVAALAEALSGLLCDPAECERLGGNGRHVALRQYSEAQMVDRFETLYREIAARATGQNAAGRP